jgi:Ser-tRNA(Ala) deacylase AlaX
MRLHFAAEIVLELTYRNLGLIKKIGAHIAQDKARIDFEWGGNISNVLTVIQKEALSLIEANQEIISAFSNEETEERHWEIPGFAWVPGGGLTIPSRVEGKAPLSINPEPLGRTRGLELVEKAYPGCLS